MNIGHGTPRTPTRRTPHGGKRLFVRGIAGSVVLALTLTATAAADEPESTGYGVNTSAVDAQMLTLSNQYTSMTVAMANYYASSRGLALGAYLADNPSALSKLAGNNPQLGNAMVTTADIKSPEQLAQLLAGNGATLDVKSWTSIAAAGDDLKAKAESIDAAVVNAGMTWAQALTAVQVPTLNVPGTPGLDRSASISMPAEGLAFGLFLNQSLANLIGNFPDVFAQVKASGIADPSSQAAWQKSMATAAAASKVSLTNVAGSNPCGAAFVDGLTGNSPKGCSPCAVAGRYANAQMQLLFNPSAGSKALDPTNPAVTATEWANLTPALKKAILQQNPGLAKTVDDALKGTAGCKATSKVTTRASGDAVKKVLDFLNKP